MSKGLRNNLLKYGITAVVGALMAYATMRSYGFADAATTADKLKILADAFTIPGVVLIMFACLVLVANGGFFNGISYAVSYAVRMLIPGANKDVGKYEDYVKRRSGKKKLKCCFLFWVGAVYLVIAILLIVLYYNI